MNLSQLAKATAVTKPNHTLLIYGPPKSGKTKLVGTAAAIDEIENIYWFDIENGVETLLGMGLTEAQMDKITVIKVRNTRSDPIAIETVLKAFTAKKPASICETHGRVDCAVCAKAGLPFISWWLGMCTHNDLVVIDSGSELGDSALAAACLGKPEMYKPGYDEYGQSGKWLGDICSVIQQATNTNFAMITHEIALEDDEKKDRIFPLMGTKNFSMRCAKFFGTVCYIHKKMNKHVAGSSSTYRGDVLTGSRLNVKLEDSKEPNMRNILIDSGILKVGSSSSDIPISVVEEAVAVPAKTPAPAPVSAQAIGSLAERIKAKKLAAAG